MAAISSTATMLVQEAASPSRTALRPEGQATGDIHLRGLRPEMNRRAAAHVLPGDATAQEAGWLTDSASI